MALNAEALKLDFNRVEIEVKDFIRDAIQGSGSKGLIVGLSGGIDSSVTVTLCVKAVGPDKVLGLLMPDAGVTPQEDIEDAKSLASSLKIETCTVPIDGIVECFKESLPLKSVDRVTEGNVSARTRMVLCYFFANALNRLVVGTGDRSENLIGYFTKYGDGGVDLLPLGHLYKTQVRALAVHLGIPEKIIAKPSSPRLWPGHKATDEIPVDYDVLDIILHGLIDLGMNPGEVASDLDVSVGLVEEVLERFETSKHKRDCPPMPNLLRIRP